MRAYVFIGIRGDTPAVMRELRRVPGVKAADALWGPTDAIAQIEAADAQGLTETVFRIRSVAGVASTDTRIAFEA